MFSVARTLAVDEIRLSDPSSDVAMATDFCWLHRHNRVPVTFGRWRKQQCGWTQAARGAAGRASCVEEWRRRRVGNVRWRRRYKWLAQSVGVAVLLSRGSLLL